MNDLLLLGVSLFATTWLRNREANNAPAPAVENWNGDSYVPAQYGEFSTGETGDVVSAPVEYVPAAPDAGPEVAPAAVDSAPAWEGPQHHELAEPDTPPVSLDQTHRQNDVFVTFGDRVQNLDNILTNPNVKAFLDVIAYSEGADYDTLFGGGKFSSFADHPRQIVKASGYSSSAAGRYQILKRTWDDIRPQIGAPDFSPEWQDRAAVFLIKRRGALADVVAGKFEQAIRKVSKEWASLPGAGYGQPERKLAQLQAVYADAGGAVA